MIYFIVLPTKVLRGRNPDGTLLYLDTLAILAGPFGTEDEARQSSGWPARAQVKGYESPRQKRSWWGGPR